jgi:hypothetical protein
LISYANVVGGDSDILLIAAGYKEPRYQVTIGLPGVGRIVIQATKPELTPEEQEEVLKVVKDRLAKIQPQ